MKKPIVFMFSGQGSQYYHMAKELFASHPVFKQTFLRLDPMVKEVTGESMVESLYNSQQRITDRFDQIKLTHPSIFMVQYALAQVLLEKGIEPDYVLGASLGEIVAATVAKVMTPEEALECIMTQAHLVEKHCEPGSMMAILHQVRLYDETPILYRHSELAAINFDSHFVISGVKEGIQEIANHLASNQIVSHTLPISYAFHSSFIDPMEEEFKGFLHKKTNKRPAIPFISCVDGEIKEELSRDYFWEVARKPIQFPKAINKLQKKHQEAIFIDLGPRGTLSNFLKYNKNPHCDFSGYSVITPYQQELNRIEKIFAIYNENQRKRSGQEVYV